MPAGDFRFRVRKVHYPNQKKTPGYQDPLLRVGNWELYNIDLKKWVPLGPADLQVSNPVMKAESCYDQNHGKFPYTSGGPFTKINIEFPPIQVLGNGVYTSGDVWRAIWGVGTGPLRYTGGFSNPSFQGDPSSYTNLDSLLGAASPLIPSLAGWSPQAFSRTRPKLEKAGMAVAIAELRDLPRMLRTSLNFFTKAFVEAGGSYASRQLAPKGAADHFLNHQFGWVPFISDLQKLISVFQSASALKSRIRLENDRWVTRRQTLLDDSQETTLAADSGMRVEPAGDHVSILMSGSPSWRVLEKKTSLITTAGSFKYYRPEFDESLDDYSSVWRKLQRELTLYGVRISPSNIYKVIPWTWLIDWVTDFGSVVDRINDWAYDSIVCKYLYLMRRDVREVVLQQTLPFKDGGTRTIEFSRLTDVKIRRASDSPYGFGLTWSGLSPRQLAILAALGITRFT